MLNFIKNKFLFIILISIITLGGLIIGAMTLYKQETTTFSSDGYIIETTTKANKKHYFKANTEYKENVEKQITFSDTDNNKVSVDPASFVHYSNGDVTFLKKGALVNLTELESSMINYYSITNKSTIKYEDGSYLVSANNKEIKIESFMGRISDNKYLISGKDLELKIPQNNELIKGEYFEILFIEDGIVKIDNEKASYQVTAQDTYIKVGKNITINLGTGKIHYEDNVKMLISQLTISNDENINLDFDKNYNDAMAGGGGGGGSGSGTGDGDGSGDGTGEGEGEGGTGEGNGEGTGSGGEGTGEGGEGTGNGGSGDGDGTGDGSSEGTGEGGSGSGSGGNGEGVNVTASLQVELIEANVTSTTINLALQLNNTSLIKNKLLYYFTNLSTGKREGNSKYIDLVDGTYKINQESLSPSTDYSFTIVETNDKGEKQYFQKTFKTKDLGITLEKLYATESSLAYKVNFDENTDVTKARVSICEETTDKDGNTSCKESNNNQVIVSKEEIGKEIIFGNEKKLKSNTTYAVSVDMVWINNAAYSEVYTINRLDTTLKKKPTISGIKVNTNAEEVRFDIKLEKISDPDKSIQKYKYEVYKASDITVDNLNPIPVYTVSKNDSDDLVINVNEIDEIKSGVDYRCKIYAEYNDNEMVREVSTEYSSNFLIKTKPKIEFIADADGVTINRVSGTLNLIDPNCSVPMNGRTCFNKKNTFILRYYKINEDEHNKNDTVITFDPKTLSTKLDFLELESNTKYYVKLFGGYYTDDEVFVENLQIGNTFEIKTDKTDNIYFEAVDNTSGVPDNNTVVTINATFVPPQGSNIMEEISTITFNLYSGRYNTPDKKIGTFTITDKKDIHTLFNKMTITNKLFKDTTNKVFSELDTVTALIKATNNGNNTLNKSYTIEVEDVYDSTGLNKITVENNIYTFNLKNEYYLDTRIQTNPNEKYLTVDLIKKEEVWAQGNTNLEEPSEEYLKLKEKITNLDDLKDDTIVGIKVENGLSDIFVDDAFTYEKVIVDYVICNNATKPCNTIINDIISMTRELNTMNEGEEKEIKKAELEKLKEKVIIRSVDMYNKYQPKEQVFYLDPIELDDGDKHFTRGYKYKVGYYLRFETKDQTNPIYYNNVLETKDEHDIRIERQDPIYKQYIYSSNDSGITYKYSFTDIDNAIAESKFYYTLDDNLEKYLPITSKLQKDGAEHEVTIPINKNSKYSLYYPRRNTSNMITYTSISDYMFEKEYNYDDSVSYQIIDDNTNMLKIKLENNDFTARAHAYKVTIKADEVKNTYTRYFLNSKLDVILEPTGQKDENGEEIYLENKYIAIDYANLIHFMGKEMNIEVYCYYESGWVGINQTFNSGFILKNNENLYLNTYHQGKDKSPTPGEDEQSMGIYHIKKGFSVGNKEIFIYNHLVYDASKQKYDDITGIENETNLDYYGINYKIDYTDKGIVFSNENNKYSSYNFRVLNGATLKTNNNKFMFESIVPSIRIVDLTAPDKKNLPYDTDEIFNNTINSIKLNIEATGIYGNKQFLKDGQTHDTIYIDIYSDKETTNHLKQIKQNVKIISTDTGYEAKIDEIVYENLKPNTTYYFTISAYINNEYMRLFDTNVKEKQKKYITPVYKANTLNVKDIMKKFKFHITPTEYDKNGEYSTNTLNWNMELKSIENYGLRFELYRPDGTKTEIDPETGEEITIPQYKTVNFNGTDAENCNPDIDDEVTSSFGHVNGCYIKAKVEHIGGIAGNKKGTYYEGKDQPYSFTSKDFVYGGNYYKLMVYAIPYYNGKYDEENKLLLYKSDGLKDESYTSQGIEYEISVPKLEEATYELGNTLISGISGNNYYISVEPYVKDDYKVIKYGKYNLTLKNDNNEIVKEIKDIVINSRVNEVFKFDGLKPNSLYYLEFSHESYMNNIGLNDDEKHKTSTFTTFTYTPVNNNITLGSITARQENIKSITLTYNGSSNLGAIGLVKYTIKENGTNSMTSGIISMGGIINNKDKYEPTNGHIFEPNGVLPKIKLNFGDTGFTLNTGKTYMITTQYFYYTYDGKYPIIDQNSGYKILTLLKDLEEKSTYTTILNT